jgi:predicted nucleotidyltransferase component of viral defense system
MNDAVEVYRELAASPELFREHVQYTARQTGFRGEVVEKDFYCSVLLSHLAEPFKGAVAFKGGTCLSKVHTRFYRLSEDLDFASFDLNRIWLGMVALANLVKPK